MGREYNGFNEEETKESLIPKNQVSCTIYKHPQEYNLSLFYRKYKSSFLTNL